MKGKIILAGTHTLVVTWDRAEVTVKEGSTVLYSGRPFNDVLDYEDITIAASGDATFLVHTKTATETSSSFAANAFEPKMKYPYTTSVDVFIPRTVADLVTLS